MGRLKDWRRVAKRNDRSPVVFRCAIALAALVICWLCVLRLKRFQFMLDRQYPATPSALSGHWRHPCFNENWKRSNSSKAVGRVANPQRMVLAGQGPGRSVISCAVFGCCAWNKCAHKAGHFQRSHWAAVSGHDIGVGCVPARF